MNEYASCLPPDSVRPYLATMEQLCDARILAQTEGPARGDRLITVRNGSGLEFTVTPDRGMDLVDCVFRGVPIAFRTPVGYSSAARFEPGGTHFLRNWPGGLLTTAGLRNAGNPNGEFGLHGRASNLSAEDVSIDRGLRADGSGRYGLTLRGTLREAAMFGEHLRLRRTLRTAYGVNAIELTDEITNCAGQDDYVQLLYHCNLGYPFAAPDLELDAAPHPVRARTPNAEAHLDRWNKLETPVPDFAEECFFHDLAPDADGRTRFALRSPSTGIRLTFEYDRCELPNLVEWKNCQSGNYVLGIEPGNVSLRGRAEDVAAGLARRLAPGETLRTALTLRLENA